MLHSTVITMMALAKELGSFGKGVAAVLWIICLFIVEGIYHSMFDVAYFGSKGCLTEIVICGFIAAIPVMLLLKLFGYSM